MYGKALVPTLALALVGACSTDVSAPTALGVGGLTPAAAKVLKGTPNKIKPSNNGKKPGTGGSGSSTMELSALLNKNGSTMIEASTGSLEDGTTNGTFSKMQLKLYPLPDTFIVNFTGLTSGYWTTTDGRLRAGDSLQAKGTIKPPSGKGTDNVTVTTAVHLRPDLAVSQLSVGQALRGIPTSISFVVSELNADRGARADCLLGVDGQVVDRANGIWVDAGTEVLCQFAYTFTTLGDHAVKVSALNVRPGDWDSNNNTALTSVTVVSPVLSIFTGGGGIFELDSMAKTTTTLSGLFTSEEHERDQEAHTTLVELIAHDTVATPPMQSAEVSVGRDGAEVDRMSASLSLSSDLTLDGVRSRCYDGADNGEVVQVCTSESATGGSTRYHYFANNGRTVFYGHDVFCGIFGCDAHSSPNGITFIGFGSSLGYVPWSTATMRATFVDSLGDKHSMDRAFAPFTLLDDFTAETYGCSGGGGFSTTTCVHYFRTGYRIQAFAIWP